MTHEPRRYLEVNGCASFSTPKVHFLAWETYLWSGPAEESRRIEEGIRFSDRHIIYHHGGRVIPALCKHLYCGKWGHARPEYREPLVSSEPDRITCAVCMVKLVMLGISCGCMA